MTTTPRTAAVAAVYKCSGTSTAFATTEPMNEVNLSGEGKARYTVYEITLDSRRNLDTSVVPTFEADTANNGVFVTITPAEIEYPGGRIILSSARGATDVVRAKAGGKYFTPVEVLGGTVAKINRKALLEAYALFGDDWWRRHMVGADFSVTLDTYVMSNCAEYTTSGGNANSHITIWHEDGGIDGNNITLTLTNPGAPGALAVTVSGNDISVALAYADGAITTTAQLLVEALEANAFVRALGARAKIKATENGTGLVAALLKTNLAGGADPVDFTAETNTLIIQIYKDDTSDDRYEGYCWIANVNEDIVPGKLIMENLEIQGHGKLYRRVS